MSDMSTIQEPTIIIIIYVCLNIFDMSDGNDALCAQGNYIVSINHRRILHNAQINKYIAT